MYYSLDDYVFFNSFQCVVGKEVKSCIFHKVRSIEDINERIEYIKNLRDTEKKQIYLEHKKCMYKRENIEIETLKDNTTAV